MTSILLRGFPSPAAPHVDVRIYAGPDPQHRARVGTLTLRAEEWTALYREFGDGVVIGMVTVEAAQVDVG